MTKWHPTLSPAGAETDLPNTSEPRYRALADAIERDIFAGILSPGDRLPTHRDLADLLGCNVSTVTRGYAEAERRGLVAGTVGRGTFVSSDARAATPMVSFEPCAPGMIEMGLVEPFHELDPEIHEGLRALLRRKDPGVYLRYSDPRGLPEHRNAGVEWMARYGLRTEPDRVLVCSGAQHALTCCLAGLLRTGDRVATDALTYPGLKTLAAMLGIRLVPVAMDADGMLPETLDTACRRDTVRGLYCMPGVHNPTTATMPAARRQALADVAVRHGLIIIEDDAYDLTVRDEAPPVAALAPDNTVYVAGLSKALAAGLRVAYMSAPPRHLDGLARAILNTTWMTAPINAALAAQWIQDGTADRAVQRKREAARERYRLAGKMLGDCVLRGPETGFFVWLELPVPWTGLAFETRARHAGVNLFGAEKFVVGDHTPPSGARIAISGPRDMDELRRGLEVVRKLLETPETA